MRKILLIICILALTTLVGCASKSENTSSETAKIEDINSGFSQSQSVDIDDFQSYEINTENSSTKNIIIENTRKIIKKADITLETDNFDEVISKVEEYIKKFNGYIESSNIYQDGINSNNYKSNRTAEFVIRVPNDNFEPILSDYGKLGVVTNKRLYGEDVSSDYFDKEARLDVLESQEKRYLEILEKANNINDIIEVEKALTEVRYEIEYLTGYLKKMDDLINLSTVNLYIYEVNKISDIINEPKTLSDEIINTFNTSIKNLKEFMVNIVLFFVAAIPFLIIAAIITIILILIIKIIKKNKKN